MMKSFGIYDPVRNVTDIYVYYEDQMGNRWARIPGKNEWIQCVEGAEIPRYCYIPGKLEMV